MVPSLLTICALLILGVHMASLGLLLRGRDTSFAAKPFAAEIAQLLEGDRATAAVERCSALPPRTPARELLLYLLGLELPTPSPALHDAGYRAAPALRSFADEAQPLVATELARVRRALLPYAIAAVLTGLGTAVAGSAALLFGADGWGAATMSIATTGVVGSIFGASIGYSHYAALGIVRDELLPLLQPAEEASDDRRTAARRARNAYDEGPRPLSLWPVAATALAAVLVAIAIAFVGAH